MTDTPITGREPRLSKNYSQRGQWRLSPKKLATMFNLVSPNAVSLPAIEAALKHHDYFVRYNAAKTLGRRADRDARLVMQEVLTNGEVSSRASVARFLYGFSWYAGESLIRQALADTDPRVREAAIYALCDFRQAAAFHLMAEHLADEIDDVRAAAAWGLRVCQDPASVPVLGMVMRANDPDVRVKALEVLGANGIPEAIPLVRHGITDPEPDVSYAATLSLLELREIEALADLANLIRQAESAARPPILRGFFHATNYLRIDIANTEAADEVLDALEIALNDDLPETRMGAAWPLAWIRHPRAENLLKSAYYQEQNETVKGHYVYVAVNLLSPLGPELVQDALNSQSDHIRQMAQQVKVNLPSR